MLFNDTIFFGIDPTAGRRPFVYAAINHELSPIINNQGTIDDVLAFAAGQNKAFVGICAPRRPNLGLMSDSARRQNLSPVPNPGRWEDFRVVEYLLWQRNIRIPRTPRKMEDCPNWMQMGFYIYERLEDFGYRAYPDDEAGCQYMEVYPHASFSVLLGILPFNKKTLEGRLQRQLVLYDHDLKVADPMRLFEEITRFRLLNGMLPLDTLYEPGELDALVAAYTAWIAASKPETTIMIGDLDEGQIILPKHELKERYF